MNWDEGLMLVAAGLAAGCANVIAGGGSLVSVSLMIFLGLPATVANATARPAIVAQNIFAVLGFRKGGIYADPVFKSSCLILALCALPGCLAGAWFAAARIDDVLFERLLAIVLGLVALATWYRRRRGGFEADPLAAKRPLFLAIAFFGIGFYGGFIQAGVGFIIMAAFLHATPWPLVRVNAAKVLIVLLYTLAALTVFAANAKIDWQAAAWVVTGQAAGGFLGARLAQSASESTLLRAYLILLLAFAVKLAFF